MIKIKVNEAGAKIEVVGETSNVIAEAGIIVWELKEILRKKMPEENIKAYLSAIALADKKEDVFRSF